ncbi:MAG: PH domain-containing protein [Corynebacterium sp.]|nr:PH domain-containing protein [Corynebacterium sp.]
MNGYRHVHRLTPLLRFWSLILALFTVFALNFSASVLVSVSEWLRGGHWAEVGRGTLIGCAVFVALCLALWFLSALWWRNLGFQIGREEISLRKGLISTSFRSARYDRIQAVDVVENVIARIFGLAAVRVETAGGVNSVIQIMYLPTAEAHDVRKEILSHVNVSGEDTATVVEEIPIGRSMLGAALRGRTLITLGVSALTVGTQLDFVTVLPLLAAFGPSIWSLIDASWKYNARYDAERGVLDIAYGLADRRRQSIRLHRIHGVKVSQPLLWRFLGWYEVQISVAGYGVAGGKNSGSTKILPVGTRAQALALFELVSDLTAAEIQHYAQPERTTAPTYTSPRRAWVISPLDFHRQAVTIVGETVVTHAGLLNRRVMAISASHIQELTYKRGPLSQLLKLATVTFELVTGPVHMKGADLSPVDAQALLHRLRSRRLPDNSQS